MKGGNMYNEIQKPKSQEKSPSRDLVASPQSLFSYPPRFPFPAAKAYPVT